MRIRSNFVIFAIPAILVAPLAFAAPPIKQAPPQPPMQTARHATTKETVSSATLHKFAHAYQGIVKVRGKYSVQLTKANSNKEKMKVYHQENSAIRAAVRKHMPVHKYMEVAKVIRENSSVRHQFMRILRSEQEKAPSKATG